MIPAYLTGGVSLMDSGLDLSVSDCYIFTVIAIEKIILYNKKRAVASPPSLSPIRFFSLMRLFCELVFRVHVQPHQK